MADTPVCPGLTMMPAALAHIASVTRSIVALNPDALAYSFIKIVLEVIYSIAIRYRPCKYFLM